MMDLFMYLMGELAQPTLTMSILYMALSGSLANVFAQLLLRSKPGAKSLVYLIPLFAPLLTLIFYPPSLVMPAPFFMQVSSPANGGPAIQTISTTVSTESLWPASRGEMLSIFGLLSLIGLTSSIVYLTVMLTEGEKVVSRLCGVVLIDDENSELFALVDRLSQLMHVPRPKIGIVEDLKPNAFTFGCGHKVTLVCSIGLLQLLDEREMEAVLAHELAHVRNKDFNFKALTSAIRMMSFFNPLVHLIASAVSRQREILADKVSVGFTGDAYALGKALVRVSDASRSFPSYGFRWRIASSLFMISPTRKVTSAFCSHPSIVNRLGNLGSLEGAGRTDIRRTLFLVMSCSFLVLVSVLIYQTLTSGPSGDTMFAISLGSTSSQVAGASLVWLPTSMHQHASATLIYLHIATPTVQQAINSNANHLLPLTIANVIGAVTILIGTFRTGRRSDDRS